jgi:FHA domain
VDGAFLEFSRDGQQHTVALRPDRLTLGRAGGNDLSFPQDGQVSGQHAVIEQQADDWVIRDLGSTNGTRVNGHKISGPRVLGSGDSILLGQTQLTFRAVSPARDQLAAAPPAGYLDVTEEWGSEERGSTAAPRAAAPPAHQPQAPATWPQQPQPQPVKPDPGQASPDGSARPVAAAPDVRDPAPAAGPTARQQSTRGHGHIRGTTRNVQVRKGQNDYNVLSFRVERYDSVGNRLPPVGAELAGYRSGQLSDGDDVEVSGRWSGGTLRAARVTNLSTGAQVRGMSGCSKVALAIVYTLVCLFFAGIIIAIIVSL